MNGRLVICARAARVAALVAVTSTSIPALAQAPSAQPTPWDVPPPPPAPPSPLPTAPGQIPPALPPPPNAGAPAGTAPTPAPPAAPPVVPAPAGAPATSPQASYLPPGASAAPTDAGGTSPTADEEVDWFVRLGIGLGPDGVAGNNAILDEVGYPRVKLWLDLDAAYMFHRHVGVGVWMGTNRRAAQPDEGAGVGLNAVSYFIGVEVPILLWGPRAYAFHLTPRGGFLSGQVELANPDDAPYQKTGIFGAGLSFNSFTYHLGSTIAYTYAPAPAPGGLDRAHDHGGFCVSLHGSIDG